jgi:hypothetical protein
LAAATPATWIAQKFDSRRQAIDENPTSFAPSRKILAGFDRHVWKYLSIFQRLAAFGLGLLLVFGT